MQEALELLLTYLRGVWIKRWILVVLAWAICMAGWPFVLKMPDQYASEAKVYVDTESLLSPLLRGLTIQTNPSQQIQMMVKTLFTRPNLEKIARLADLDIQANSAEDFDAIIADLKSGLNLQAAGRDNIYTIRYTDTSAQKARDVVQATLTTLVENTLGDKRADSNVAASFLDRQIQDYERRLSESDNALKEFKKRNYELMSDQGGFYQRLEKQKRTVAEIELELKEATARKRSLEEQISNEKPNFDATEATPNPQDMSTPYDTRIDALESQLDQLRLRYTEAHPNIREAQRVLNDLRSLRDVEIAEKAESFEALAANQSPLEKNPVYQEMKISLARENSTVETLSVRLVEQRKIYSELQLRINTIPEMEAELLGLQRGYDVTLGQYNELLSRRESARLSEQADVSADGFQFRVIDPPRVPNDPVGPKRPLFLSIVLAAGLAIGLGLAFVISQLRPVFFTARQLNQVTGYPVLGSISFSGGPEASAKRGRKHWLLIAMLFLFMIYSALMVLQLFPELNHALTERLPDMPSQLSQLIPKIKAMLSKLMSIAQG